MANIGLPDSLLSRFDLLFIVLDKMDAEEDRKLAAHVLRSHLFRKVGELDGTPMTVETNADVIVADDPKHDEEDATSEMFQPYVHQGRRPRRRVRTDDDDRPLTVDFVKKYVMYAKARVHPVLSTEAASSIANEYATLRDKEGEMKTLPVTARTLETMIRLSTAHAKARLSDTVEEQDARAAFDLINFAYFNEAKVVARPKKQRRAEDGSRSDGSDDDDDDDDEDRGDQAGDKADKADRAAPSTPKPAGTPARTTRSTPRQQRKASPRPHGPFDFTEDDDEAAPAPKTPAKKTPAKKTPAKKSPAKQDEPDQPQDDQQPPEAKQPEGKQPREKPSGAQEKLIRKALNTLRSAASITVQQLLDAVAKHDAAITRAHVLFALDVRRTRRRRS